MDGNLFDIYARETGTDLNQNKEKMTSGWIVFIIAVAAVGLLVIGLALTLIFKGHNIDSEIGTNRHMQKRGIRCTAGEFVREEGNLRSNGIAASDGVGCSVCNPEGIAGAAECRSCVSGCDTVVHKQ